jgi:hypothetical protein
MVFRDYAGHVAIACIKILQKIGVFLLPEQLSHRFNLRQYIDFYQKNLG